MDLTIKKAISLLCVVLVSGWVAAHCGQCAGDENTEKACCGDGSDQCCKTAETADQKVKAPDFKAKDINGKEVQLSKLKGKIVVLEWVNYDCPFVKPHYKESVMTMSKLAAKYAGKDVVWLTVNSTHYATAQTNKEWAQNLRLKQTLLVDSEGKIGKLYKAKTTPHMFIIDKAGNIVYQGAIDNAPLGKKPEDGELVNYVDKALAELTAGKTITTTKTKPYGCSVKYAKQ